jgi:endonuclease/exonuclease/phosphatase family metal-dependent hydrolase
MEFILYRDRGLWYTPALADWILHKGVLISRLTVDNLPVIILNTHLTANYSGDWSRTNMFARQEHRELQQIAEIVNAQPSESLVVVCGDFNIPRGSWLYHTFLESSGLTDPLHDSAEPTFRPHARMPARYAVPIDFALYRAPFLPSLQVESTLRFKEKSINGTRQHYLSDHLAVELRLSWNSQKQFKTDAL